MRYEILKYLSKSYDYIDLSGFIKNKYPNIDNEELLHFLKGMFKGYLYTDKNIIEIKGKEWELLGKNYIEFEDWGKCEIIASESAKIAGKSVLSRGVGSVNTIKIEARITDLGRNELDKRESNVFWGMRVSTLTIVISILSLIISIIALIRGDK